MEPTQISKVLCFELSYIFMKRNCEILQLKSEAFF